MPIAVYFNPEAMTSDQYDATMAALDAAGAGSPAGRIHHSCFGAPDHLMVYDIWESGDAFGAFGETLGPILAEVGVDVGEPTSCRSTTTSNDACQRTGVGRLTSPISEIDRHARGRSNAPPTRR